MSTGSRGSEAERRRGGAPRGVNFFCGVPRGKWRFLDSSKLLYLIVEDPRDSENWIELRLAFKIKKILKLRLKDGRGFFGMLETFTFNFIHFFYDVFEVYGVVFIGECGIFPSDPPLSAVPP